MRTAANQGERGTILLVVSFIAVAIAGLAAISAARFVQENRLQTTQENESQALNEAFGQLNLALNVVYNSDYDDQNHNLAIRGAVEEPVPQLPDDPTWMADPTGVQHGLIEGTNVRVYHASDYLMRLQKIRGRPIEDVDPFNASDGYFVLEATGAVGGGFQMVSALVRETRPFSSYVFFQDLHTLGVSGAPRGMMHANDNLAFYFPDGRYLDSVASVNGFSFRAGATQDNTVIRSGNPSAKPISLQDVDFDDLRSKANLYAGLAGLDAEIKFFSDGKARITPYTQPFWEQVEEEYTWNKLIKYETVTTTEIQPVQVGTVTEERERQVIVGWETETYTVDVPVFETRTVEKTRQVPVYDTRTVTKTRWIQVFVPYEVDDAGGGTTVGGDGIVGEYVWIEEEYQVEEQYIASYVTETYTATEQVQIGTDTEERTRDIPIYGTETYTVEVPVYEDQEVEVTEQVPVYKEMTAKTTRWVYMPPVPQAYMHVWVGDDPGLIFIDGRITKIEGDLNGRVTVVSTDKVRITDDIRYVDDSGNTAMINGSSYTDPYERNPDYTGDSVLGIIARDDILFTHSMPNSAEINGTLMSVEGRVGSDALWITADGEIVQDSKTARKKLLTQEEQTTEDAYDRTGTYPTKSFIKDSLRRLGGLISHDRIVETYVQSRKDGTAYVAAGFKRGSMQFDYNMLNSPPPFFIEIPQPVAIAFTPVLLVNDEDLLATDEVTASPTQ
jgi:hypothetical protein